MNIRTLLLASGFALYGWSMSAAAGEAGFLQDSVGNVVRDGFGECVSVDKLKHVHDYKGDSQRCTKPAEEAKAPEPKPAPPPPPKPVVLKDISLGAHALFDVNKSDLRAEGKAELDALVSSLAGVKRVDSISIVGHTDSTGAADYNQGLSERRADAVSAYLVSKGIDSAIIKTSGRGESEPVADNNTREGRQKNRRVDIVVTGVQ